MSSDLKEQLIKLGATNPELQPHLKEVLAAIDKEASESLLWEILDQRAYAKLMGAVKDDKQSLDLLRDIRTRLNDLLSLSRNEYNAINKLRNMETRNMDAGNARNQIFKVADLLGMKLPSSSF